MFRHPIRLILVLLAVAAAAAFAFERMSGRSVSLAEVTVGQAVRAVYATGIVEPENWARIAPLTTGRVAEVLVKEGDRVAKGQVMARLDDREASAKVTELEARAAYWREEMARARTLAAKGIAAREAEQKAASEYNQVAAAIAAARQRRSDLAVTAPLDGTVLRRDGEVGEVVTPETAMFWVGEPRPLRITADVDEEDIARVLPGQKVLVKADAFPDAALDGAVDRITPKGDPINKTFRVRVRLPDDTPLLVGMTTEINIVTLVKTDARLIPANALAPGDVVFVIEGGRAVLKQVKAGIRGRDRIEVEQGLEPGQTVIAPLPSGLKDGERVKATE